MCEPLGAPLDPNITREEISKRLCGDDECPGCKLFAEIGIESLAKQAKEILRSRPCCGGVKCPPKVIDYTDGEPCRGRRRCEISRVTRLPELPEPDPDVGTFCGNQECPMAYLMSPGMCRKGKPCLSPSCPWGTKDVQIQSPTVFPCGKPNCPYNERDSEPEPLFQLPTPDGTQCTRPSCKRVTVCKRRDLFDASEVVSEE